ncbi:hypothetical protein FQN60_014318 [Etheostoma spectabile]|uniref:Uncharacterized protein n=1 Tax=Etheostoma spectabile TaxID=54343 RepID=A0A5J5DA80_9PERO|nr:hypothetical protein FQN60_014318 [Etheostoma spectabile]
MKQLPARVQKRILNGRHLQHLHPHALPTQLYSHGTPLSTQLHPSAHRPDSDLHPVAGVKPRPGTGLRGKGRNGHRAAEQTCLPQQLPVYQGKTRGVGGAVGRVPSSFLSRRVDSSEDLLSDSASVASDNSDSSLNSSLLGKRMLAPPPKSALRNGQVLSSALQKRGYRRGRTRLLSPQCPLQSSISCPPLKEN